jgi:glycosyltransferase involved in cell wall biosynthesis
MNNIYFSIIIPCFNYGHTVGRAIESVLAQEGDDIEIIIINDGSTDDSEKIIKQYEKRYEHVSYYYQENKGPAAARNRGIKFAKGNYLVFLDADDAMIEGALNKARNFFKKNIDVDMLIGGYISVEAKEKTLYIQKIPSKPEEKFWAYLNKKIRAANGAMFTHKRVFDKIKYCESIRQMEDIPLIAQILFLFNCKVMNEPMAKIYRHSDSLRYNTKLTEYVGLNIVNIIFDKKILPDYLFKYKQKYQSLVFLSMFRTFYLAKEFKRAKRYYHKAVQANFMSLFKLSYIRKYIRIMFRG